MLTCGMFRMEWWLSCDAHLPRFQSADFKSILLYLVNNLSFSLVAIIIDVIATHTFFLSFYIKSFSIMAHSNNSNSSLSLDAPSCIFLLWLILQHFYCNNNTRINNDVGSGTIAIGHRRWHCNTHNANHVGTDCPWKMYYYKTQKA